MILQYKRMKHILLKHFRNANTQIKINGIITTTLFLESTKILIDKLCIFTKIDCFFI